MGGTVLQKLKRVIKPLWLKTRRSYIKTFYSFTPRDLSAAVHSLGVNPGDVLFIHSSFDNFLGFSGRLGDAIRVFQNAVGPSGTLIMPTFPFDGGAIDYVATGSITDLLRTPSQNGVLTEVFRRSPGVVRSLHPTHPVAIWGARQDEISKGHHLAQTPCGRNSPFCRLIDLDARVLLAGISIRSLTLYHGIEELLEQRMPRSPLTTDWYTAQVRDTLGVVHDCRFRLYDPAMSKSRDLQPLIDKLRILGYWRETRVGRLRLTLLHAREVFEACETLANEGVFLYFGMGARR